MAKAGYCTVCNENVFLTDAGDCGKAGHPANCITGVYETPGVAGTEPPPPSAPQVAVDSAKKPLVKKWWFWAIVILLLAGLGNGLTGGTDTDSTTTPATSTEAAPTSTEVSAEEEPEPEPEPEPTASELLDANFGTFRAVKKSGRGDGIVTVPSEAIGGIVEASHNGSSNFVIETLDDSNNNTGLLVNTIGSYKGKTLFTSNEAPVKLKVTADGSWTIKIVPVSSAKRASSSNSGSGDMVLVYEGEAADWKVTHKGSSNFVIQFLSTSGNDLLVNEIGNYSGVIPSTEGPAVVSITADGTWTMVWQ